MERQLEFWSAELGTETDVVASTDEAIETGVAETHLAAEQLFVRPERQFDYGGISYSQWPEPEVNRDSITVDRVRPDIDGPPHRFAIHRHDYVEVFVDKDELHYGRVIGISNARQQVRIHIEGDDNAVWFDTACVYPAVQHELSRQTKRQHPQHVSEMIRQDSVQAKVAKRIREQTEYTSLKVVSVVRVGSMKDRPRITSTKEACKFFARYWRENEGHDQERFVIACLDTKHAVQSVVPITIGTLDASLVHPREVFKPAIIEGSSAILLSHNHPSGNPEPSREDYAVTERLTDAGKLIGINVLDHIVYGDGSGEVVSIRES